MNADAMSTTPADSSQPPVDDTVFRARHPENVKAVQVPPQTRSVGLVRSSGPDEVKNTVDNNTSLPAYATGWFSVLASGEDGDDCGTGPERVRGSNEDDRIFTRAVPTT